MSARPLEQTAIALEWVHGANTSMINGVIDLKNDNTDKFFYASAHTGIIFDCTNNTQTLLSGHRHTITAVAASVDKNYIATADTGSQSALIIWDAHTAAPIFTKFNPHPNGICACAFSQNSQYLVTLSSDSEHQVLAIWTWNSAYTQEPEPTAIVEIPFAEQMKVVHFNPRDDSQLITNGDHSIIFWQWNQSTEELSYYSPPVTARDLKKPIGHLIYSRYLPENDDVILSTSEGSIIHIVRDPFAAHQGLEAEHKPIKVISLHKSAVTTLEIHNNYIVTGGADGCVKFFDFEFRLIAWFEEIKAGPITSISFANTTNPLNKEQFSCQPFIVATSNAAVLRLTDAVYHAISGSNQPQVLLRNHTGKVKAMAVNPNDGRLITGSDLGELIQWDLMTHTANNRAIIDKSSISALQYDPKEDFLAVGFTNGSIFVVTAENFDVVYKQRIAKNVPITAIRYSSDSSFLACTLEDNTLALFRSLDKLSPTTPMMSQAQDDGGVQMATIQQEMKKWEYVGRHRSHWDKICGLAFIGAGTQLSPHRLFTIGSDRRVVEYDFASSAYLDGVLIKMQTQVEMTAKPTSFAWTLKDSRPFFAVANTEGKLRMWNGSTMICRSTTLAPSFGGDICQMEFIESGRSSIVYATNSQVLGLVLAPLTGNPNESMGLIAHPTNIKQIAVSNDESRVLVCSGEDNYIGIFTCHPEHLEAAALIAQNKYPPGSDAFVEMLEGGRDGPLYQEIVDYFYSSQLRVQGKLTDKPHDIPQVIPIDEVVPLLCALGYYPTQYDADLIRNEIYYSEFLETNQPTETVDFNTLLKLFLNHRPVTPPSLEDIQKAFKVLGADSSGRLSTEELTNLLQSSGEAMSIEDIEKSIQTLAGGEELPSNLNAQEFIETVLGLVTYEEEEQQYEQQSGASTSRSQQSTARLESGGGQTDITNVNQQLTSVPVQKIDQ